jgi:hypothetical protein
MKTGSVFLIFLGLLSGCVVSFPEQSFNPSSQPINSSSSLTQSCNTKRLLNPDSESQPNETELDRYFRLAFNQEVAGNFTDAITYYQKAANLAECECDRQHALAGKQAAEEAKGLMENEGMGSLPTQFFWGRLQELTENLPCVQLVEKP